MKKYILVLALFLIFTLTACGSNESGTYQGKTPPEPVSESAQNQENTAETGSVESAVLEPENDEAVPVREELIKQYVGRYVLVNTPDNEADWYAELWNRGDYRYIEITEDCQYLEGAYEAGKLAGTPTEYYFDPVDCSVHWVEDHETTLYTVVIEDGVLDKQGYIYQIKE